MSEVIDEYIQVTRDADVAIVTINNPERRNAMGRQIRLALRDTIHLLMHRDACKAIVLTGAGGQFSAGADITEMTKRTVLQSREILAESCEVVREMLGGPKPVVSAVEGSAFGAGLSVAVATDYLVSATNARFCAAFLRIGLIPDTGILWTLPQKIGAAKARELLSLAREINGVEAGRIGLANLVVEPGFALSAAIDMAKKLASLPPLGIALTKAALTFGSDTMDATLRTEIDFQSILYQSQDHLGPANPLIGNLTPVFSGQ